MQEVVPHQHDNRKRQDDQREAVPNLALRHKIRQARDEVRRIILRHQCSPCIQLHMKARRKVVMLEYLGDKGAQCVANLLDILTSAGQCFNELLDVNHFPGDTSLVILDLRMY